MRQHFRETLPLLLALSLAGCGSSPQARFARAEEAYARHEYTAARLELSAVVQKQPKDAAALELLARTYLELGDGESAKSALQKLGQLGKQPPDAQVLLGEAEFMNGRFEAAIAAVAKEKSAPALRVRALASLGRNDPGTAAQAFAEGEKAGGDRSRLLADYAHFELAKGNLTAARRLAALAAQQKPASLASYLASADVAAADSQLGRALAHFDAALRDFPQSRAALLGKIRVLDALGRTGEIRPLVTAALADDANDPTLIYLDARLDALAGQWQKVRDKLQPREQALKAQPDGNILYAHALLELGQPELARARLSSQVLRTPDNRQARLLLGRSKLALGDTMGAADTLRPLAGAADANSEELGLLARALKEAGDPQASSVATKARQAAGQALLGRLATADKAIRAKDWPTAIRSYEEVLKQTDGSNVLVLNNLAFAYDQTGNPEKALGFAERALKLAPDNASVMDTTGWLLHRSGKDRKRALGLLRAAAGKAPGNAAIAAHLSQAAGS